MLFRTEKFKNPHFSHKARDSAVKKTTKDRNISEKCEKRERVNVPVMQYCQKMYFPHTFFDNGSTPAKRKYRQKCTSMYTFDSEFWQNQNIASAWNLPPSMAVASFFTRAVT